MTMTLTMMMMISVTPIFFQLDAEYEVLLEIKQHKNSIRENDDEDNVDVGESDASVDADIDADDDNEDDDEDDVDGTINYKKQEESDDTQ